MGRTEIAGFQPQTYKTLQSDARKTTISQHKINDMGVVQGELTIFGNQIILLNMV
jgi:hypothetical protein